MEHMISHQQQQQVPFVTCGSASGALMAKLKACRESGKLCLSNAALTGVPEEVWTVHKMNFGENWWQLKPLLHLQMEHNQLTELPEDAPYAEAFAKLRKLSLAHNQLRHIPSHALLSCADELRHMNVSHNNFTRLSFLFENGVKWNTLTVLRISHNRLTELPKSFANAFPQLRLLDVSHNGLTQLPCLSACEQLTEVYVHHNQLTSLPVIGATISSRDNGVTASHRRSQLRELHAHNNHIERLSLTQLLMLPSLQLLQLCHNRITKVTTWPCEDSERVNGILKYRMDSTAAQLSTSSSSSSRTTATKSAADVRHRRRERLRQRYEEKHDNGDITSSTRSRKHMKGKDEIGAFPLENIQLAFNGLTELPCLHDMALIAPNLKVFNVSDNALQQLSGDVVKAFPHLTRFNVSNNSLTTLPADLGCAHGTMSSFIVSGNPIRVIRRSILESGTQSLLSYLFSRRRRTDAYDTTDTPSKGIQRVITRDSDCVSVKSAQHDRVNCDCGQVEVNVDHARVPHCSVGGDTLSASSSTCERLSTAVVVPLSTRAHALSTSAVHSQLPTSTAFSEGVTPAQQRHHSRDQSTSSQSQSTSTSTASALVLSGVAPSAFPSTATHRLEPHAEALRRLKRVSCQLEEVKACELVESLTSVNVSHNRITQLPKDAFATLTQLTQLTLSHNRLTSLPSELRHCSHLVSVKADHNRLSTFDVTLLSSWKQLRLLDLSVNMLTSLEAKQVDPKAVCELRTLNVSHNRLTCIPNWCQSAVALETLHLNDNKLTDEGVWSRCWARVVPQQQQQQQPTLERQWWCWTSLVTLMLHNNDIKRVPLELADASCQHTLHTLTLAGNRIRRIRQSLLTSSDAAPLMRYLRSRKPRQ